LQLRDVAKSMSCWSGDWIAWAGRLPIWWIRSKICRNSASVSCRSPNAELVADVVGLAAGSGVATAVVYSRNFNVRQFHSANVVLVGSRISNPWVEIFEEKLNFRMDLSSGTLAIRNQHPLSGEQDLYRNSSGTGQPGVSYGVIAFLPNPDRTGNVLVIAGLHMEATEGAGQFLSAEESFAPFARSLMANQRGAIPYLEGLVRTTKMAVAAENLKVVACRRLVF
jgi:hypothetical protein